MEEDCLDGLRPRVRRREAYRFDGNDAVPGGLKGREEGVHVAHGRPRMRRVDLDLYLADPRAGPVDPREDVPLRAFDVDLEHVEVVVAELPHVGRKARGVVGREVATVVYR